ncbi:MAG: hypothetical protein AAGM67_13445, partial [Bacteroidota bacterium]
MHNLKLGVLLLLLGGFIMAAQSQIIQKTAYIVPQSGDTLYGQINISDETQACQSVLFIDPEGNRHSYTPADILAYGYGHDQHYRRAEVGRTDQHGLPLPQQEAVFLHLLRAGSPNLYQWTHQDGYSLYVQTAGEAPKLLHYQLTKVKQASIGLSKVRLQDGTEFHNLSPGQIAKDEMGRLFIFQDNQLYQLSPQYHLDLTAALPDDSPAIEGELALKKPVILKHIDQRTSLRKLDRRPRLQLDLSGFIHGLALKNQSGIERGVSLELRNNQFSPRFALRYGFSGLTINSDQEDAPLRLTTYHLGINYHFRPGKALRPYLTTSFIRLTNNRIYQPGTVLSLDITRIGAG